MNCTLNEFLKACHLRRRVGASGPRSRAQWSLSLNSTPWTRTTALSLCLLLAAPVVSSAARVHEIPASVTVLAIFKPESDRLRVLLRVPLESMRDFQFPVRDSVYLEVSRAQPLLIPAAKLWLLNYLEVYEGKTRLSGDSVLAARISLPSDKSFVSYDSALAHMSSVPVSDSVALPWKQALLDVLIEYPITSARHEVDQTQV